MKIVWLNVSRMLLPTFDFSSPLLLYPIANLFNILNKNTVLKGKTKHFFNNESLFFPTDTIY